jgi:hypothetical protein
LAALMGIFVLGLSVVFAGCSGDTDEPGPQHATPETPTPISVTPSVVTTPTPEPTEFRVAFVNLHNPLFNEDPAVAATFEERLTLVIEELRAFNPDVVGFNEWFKTPALPDVATTLGKELQMEPCFQRANPWYPGQTKEESDRLVDEAGFEEGELILVRSDIYPPLDPCERYVLQPLTSESGEVRIGVHLVIRGPSGFGGDGEVDIFLTHLKGGSDAIRAEQAADFASWVAEERGSGPSIVLVGQDDPLSASNYDAYRAIGLRDAFSTEDVLTCCRVSVVGEQQPMTARNDYLMYDRMQVISAALLGVEPATRVDGSLVYASDHLGIGAVFRVPNRGSAPLP